MLLRLFFLFFITSLFLNRLIAQIEFDAKGRVIFLKECYDSKADTNSLETFDITKLTIADASIKLAGRKVLLKKLDETLKIITTREINPGLHDFYELCWGDDLTLIEKYIDSLRSAITRQTVADLTNALSTDFKMPLSNHLFNSSQSIFTVDLDQPAKVSISIWKKDPFTNCIVDYYNATLAGKPKISLKIIIDRLKFLGKTRDSLNSLIIKGRNEDFDADVYINIKSYHQELHTTGNEFQSIQTELNSNWFKQWFWFRGGEIRLNPFDFTTQDFFQILPAADVTKADLFNRFIDSAIERQIRYDTSGIINSFEQKLRLKNRGNIEFSLKARNDSIMTANEEKLKSFLATKKLLNKVEIPKNGTFFSFSAITDIKLLAEHKREQLEETLRAGEKKKLAVHNILTGAKAGLIESGKSIADKSSFQLGFDTTVSQLGQLAALALQLNPYTSFLSYFTPVKNPKTPIIPAPDLSGEDGVPFAAMLTFELFPRFNFYYRDLNNLFKAELKANLIQPYHLMDSALLFDAIFSDFNFTVRQVKSDSQIRAKAVSLLKTYFSIIIAKQVVLLQQDSLLASHFIRIFNESTLPPEQELGTTEDDTPTYYSKILETTPSDEASLQTVKIFSVQKDTTFIDKFSYKVGKNSRFKLGAGIAYTLHSFDQSKATESNGNISITNDVNQVRFVVGLHIYFGKGLFSLNDKLLRLKERNSFFIGVGIPNPIENVYVGLSHDIVPGLKLTAGAHIARSNKYFIQNNSIIEETRKYQVAGPFVSLGVDPASFISLLNIFKK